MIEQKWMNEALTEGRKGCGLTAPNPSVGAVVVLDGKVIGRGYHSGAGKPHAEVEALADVRKRGLSSVGSDVYVTLEPCSTTGRTPPCTTALKNAEVARVIWAADDPNPVHQGSARQILEKSGIKVVTGVLQEEAEFLHRAFFKVQQTRLPWVTAKTALSLDGRITRPLKESQWLTGEESRKDVQNFRGEADVIITSGKTARIDNPKLSYRGSNLAKKQPLRVVITNQDRAGLSEESHLLKDEGFEEPARFVAGDLRVLLEGLANEGYQSILLECGGELLGQFLEQKLVDEWISYFSPIVCGGDRPATGATGVSTLNKRPRLKKVSYVQFENDIRVRGLVSY